MIIKFTLEMKPPGKIIDICIEKHHFKEISKEDFFVKKKNSISQSFYELFYN